MPRPRKQLAKAAKAADKPVETVAKTPAPKQEADGRDLARAMQIPVSRHKTMNAIWGIRENSFGTDNPEEYLKKIRGMTKLDLQRECIKHQFQPDDNREKMIQLLYKKCSFQAALVKTSDLQPKIIKMSAAGSRILAKTASLT